MVGGMVLKGGVYGVAPPVCVLVSPSRLRGGRVEGREAVVCGVPISGMNPPPHIVQSFPYCLTRLLSCVWWCVSWWCRLVVESCVACVALLCGDVM